MPRIRSIKPDFWTSAQVLECSPNARLLFIGIWNFCDDAGRHAFSAKQCKAEVFPADNFSVSDVESMLTELVKNELIVPYTHENKAYFYVSGWKHQKIDKPQSPRCPDPFGEHSTIDRRPFDTDRIGEDRKGKDRKGEDTLSSTCVDVWNAKAAQLKAQGLGYAEIRGLTKDRRVKLRSRLAEAGWLDAFNAGVESLPIRQWSEWVPDFDWMVANSSNALKLAEGKFHKASFTQADKNRQTMNDYEPTGILQELISDAGSGHRKIQAADANPLRGLPSGSNAGSG